MLIMNTGSEFLSHCWKMNSFFTLNHQFRYKTMTSFYLLTLLEMKQIIKSKRI